MGHGHHPPPDPFASRILRARRSGDVERAATHVEESRAFSVVARVGIGSRVVIYLVLGILTVQVAARGHSSSPTNAQGAFEAVGSAPGGIGFLVVLAAALVAYATWRALQSITGQGGADGAWARVGVGLAGALYLAFCADTISLATGGGHSSGQDLSVAATVLRWPAGAVLLGAAGVALGVGAVCLAVFGIRRDYSKVLEPRHVPKQWLRAARLLGGAGDAGRGGAMALVAVALVAAAVRGRGAASASLGSQLQGLSHHPGGTVVICAVAAGFFCFAAYSVVELAHRRV